MREGFRYLSARDHLGGAFALYTVVGALLGLLVSALAHLEWLFISRWAVKRGRLVRLLRPLFYGIVAGVAASDTAVWTFSGEKAQASPLAVWGPVAFCVAIGVGAFAGSALLLVRDRRLRSGGGRSCGDRWRSCSRSAAPCSRGSTSRCT